MEILLLMQQVLIPVCCDVLLSRWVLQHLEVDSFSLLLQIDQLCSHDISATHPHPESLRVELFFW